MLTRWVPEDSFAVSTTDCVRPKTQNFVRGFGIIMAFLIVIIVVGRDFLCASLSTIIYMIERSIPLVILCCISSLTYHAPLFSPLDEQAYGLTDSYESVTYKTCRSWFHYIVRARNKQSNLPELHGRTSPSRQAS